jgi:hypothetical protein
MKNKRNHYQYHFGLILALVTFCGGITLVVGPAGGASAPAVAQSWSQTGNLNLGRFGHTATLLPNGKVLVAGGDGTGNSAELYDPFTGIWIQTGNLNMGRDSHTATLLPNGKVLIAGGYNYFDNSVPNTAELYDPFTGTWSTTGHLNTGRNSHTATLLPDGKVLISGGFNYNDFANVTNTSELYDPATGMWSYTGNLLTRRESHTATLLATGKVLVAGGFDHFPPFGSWGNNAAELYDPTTGIWSNTGFLNTPRGFHTATLLQDGNVLVVGGSNLRCLFDPDCIAFDGSNTLSSVELYDSAQEIWSAIDGLSTSRALHSATLLPNANVLVVGGLHVVNVNGQTSALYDSELYHPATRTWSDTGRLNTGRYLHTATLLSPGNVLIAGGSGDSDSYLNTAQLYAMLPSAARATIAGEIATGLGNPFPGVVVRLSGARNAFTITDSAGRYSFTNLEVNGFYNVTPALSDFVFVPSSRSFSLLGDKTDAVFTGTANPQPTTNPLDTVEFFVRQQYVDFLGREPEQGGLEYWSAQINLCNSDAACLHARRVDVSAAFFVEHEFQQSSAFLIDIYKDVLGRNPSYAEYSIDHIQVIAGPNLESGKTAFSESFVQRAEFINRYPADLSADSFVAALISSVQLSTSVNLSNRRDDLISTYNSGQNSLQSRALVLRAIGDDELLKQAFYNSAFVLAEYFGYLQRDPEPAGYDYWLNILNYAVPNNYRSMVCSFITSAEYQLRFGPRITRTNRDCSQ